MRKWEIALGIVDLLVVVLCGWAAYAGISVYGYGMDYVFFTLIFYTAAFAISATLLLVAPKRTFIVVLSTFVGFSYINSVFSLVSAAKRMEIGSRDIATFSAFAGFLLLVVANMVLLSLRGTRRWLKKKDELPRVKL